MTTTLEAAEGDVLPLPVSRNDNVNAAGTFRSNTEAGEGGCSDRGRSQRM